MTNSLVSLVFWYLSQLLFTIPGFFLPNSRHRNWNFSSCPATYHFPLLGTTVLHFLTNQNHNFLLSVLHVFDNSILTRQSYHSTLTASHYISIRLEYCTHLWYLVCLSRSRHNSHDALHPFWGAAPSGLLLVKTLLKISTGAAEKPAFGGRDVSKFGTNRVTKTACRSRSWPTSARHKKVMWKSRIKNKELGKRWGVLLTFAKLWCSSGAHFFAFRLRDNTSKYQRVIVGQKSFVEQILGIAGKQ